MLADRHIRHRPRHRFTCILNPDRYRWQQFEHLLGEVVLGKQPIVFAVTLVDELVVDVRQRNSTQRIAGAQVHPGLYRAVVNVLRLDPGRSLDLDHPPAVVPGIIMGQQNILAHQHPFVLQGGFEDGRPEHRGHQLLSLFQCPFETAALVVDESAAIPPIQLNRQVAHFVTQGESGFGLFGEMSEILTIDFEMHPLQALQRGHDAGFGEPGRGH